MGPRTARTRGKPRTPSCSIRRVGERSTIPPMTTFSVRFLGCKVSHVDAHAVRERLLADGHSELDLGADVAVVNTCCVTNEAVAKSRKEAARAARTHRRVYVTGCGANLAGDAFAGLPENVRRRRGEERADAGDRRRRRRRDRLRPGRRAPRSRARLRQGAGRLLVLVQASASSRSCAAPRAAAPPTPCSERSAAASRRGIARSFSPGSTSAATATAPPATTCRGSCARRGRRPACSACGSPRSRSTT